MKEANMSDEMYLSIVIPSYNESQNIARGVLDRTIEYLVKQPFTWELILSDDGSSDGTAEHLDTFAAKHKNISVIHNSHRGKGPTVFAGMQKAKGKLRLFSDFDQATPIEEVEKLLPFFHRGYDVVIGSREVQGAKREKEPIHRHIMGRVFNVAVKTVAIKGIQDTQCGFKMFTAEAVETLFPLLYIYKPGRTRSDSYTGAFDVELLYIAEKLKMKIAEVPVYWSYMESVRVDPIKDSTRMFIDLLRIRLADFKGAYDR